MSEATTVPETAPEMGGLSIEPLETGAFSRCEETSGCRMAETENGYYSEYAGQYLYYADKTDLGNWVIVCNQPDCLHKAEDTGCSARIGNAFLLRDGRIYYVDDAYKYSQSDERGKVLASMAMDGTGRSLAYSVETYVHPEGGELSYAIYPDHVLFSAALMGQDGTFDTQLLRVDENGSHLQFEGKRQDGGFVDGGGSARALYGIFGDDAVVSEYPEEVQDGMCTTLYRETPDGLEIIGDFRELGLKIQGSYLSGDTLTILEPGDGYYRINLQDGTREKLADNQLGNSKAAIFQPNCILESNLLYISSVDGRTGDGEVRFYDGTGWKTVTLPEEMVHPEAQKFLLPMALASDRIFFYFYDTQMLLDGAPMPLYQLLLGEEQPRMTCCGEIG